MPWPGGVFASHKIFGFYALFIAVTFLEFIWDLGRHGRNNQHVKVMTDWDASETMWIHNWLNKVNVGKPFSGRKLANKNIETVTAIRFRKNSWVLIVTPVTDQKWRFRFGESWWCKLLHHLAMWIQVNDMKWYMWHHVTIKWYLSNVIHFVNYLSHVIQMIFIIHMNT